MSLKSKLTDKIKLEGELSYDYVKMLVESGYFGRKYRISCAERRLRESPDIEIIKENGCIVKYRFIGEVPKPIGFMKVEGENLKIPIYY